MKSLKELYKIGRGPSSSHTMGPAKAAAMFAQKHREADSFEVTLYGSLAATGKGHLTDVAVTDALSDGGRKRVDIIWKPDVFLPFHPNAMKFTAKDYDGNTGGEWTVYSIGGGTISEGPGSAIGEGPDIYDLNTIAEIVEWCKNSEGNCDLIDLLEDRGKVLEQKSRKEIATDIYISRGVLEIISARGLDVYIPTYLAEGGGENV